MPVVKNYKRTDRIDDFLDACIDFAGGGEVNGHKFDSIKDAGAIEALWSAEIEQLVEIQQIGAGALKWDPLTADEKTMLLSQADEYLAANKKSPRP